MTIHHEDIQRQSGEERAGAKGKTTERERERTQHEAEGLYFLCQLECDGFFLSEVATEKRRNRTMELGLACL